MPVSPTASRSTATNLRFNVDVEIDSIFMASVGEELEPAVVVTGSNTSVPLVGSYTTCATQRIGDPAARINANLRVTEDTETGGIKIGSVTLLGEGRTIADFDSNRQGKNVVDLTHFSRMNLPLISINREGMLTRKNHVKHVAAFNNYGITKLFKSYDEFNRVAIPFEDFPGRLDPVAYVSAGDYVLQYMIINDLTKDIDKFTNPDDLNGVVEVFEIRESFANTSISDIQTRGIRGSMTNENFYAIGQGASPIDNKSEINQNKSSFFEDAADVMYGHVTFSPREGYVTSGSFVFEGAVPDESRIMSPFTEAHDDLKINFSARIREFIGGEYTGSIASETIVPELGTRYRSSNRGFIMSPSYVIMDDRFVNPGTDSIAFIGMSKT